MANKYNRTNFMPVVSGSDYLERDMLLSQWDLFEIKRPIQFNSIKRQDLLRPDLLAIKIYGNMSLWWILLKVNNIDDCWNEMDIGQDIIVPHVDDISDFVLAAKRRIKKLKE